jgi:hypothetical protein
VYGVYQRINLIIQEIWNDLAAQLEVLLRLCNPPSLENELRLMYGRGEITSEKYRQLVAKARKHQLGRGDVEILRAESLQQARQAGKVAPPVRNKALARQLDRLLLGRVQLEDVQFDSEKTLAALRADLNRLNQQAVEAREAARQALPDEAEARRYLEREQMLLEKVRLIEARLTVLQRGLRRIETLHAELVALESGLKSLDTQEQLTKLELKLRESMHNW